MFSLRGRGRGPIRWGLAQFLQEIVVRTAKQVFREDAAIFAAVQRGMEASPFPGVIGTREERIYVFQEFVRAKCESLFSGDTNSAAAKRTPLPLK